MKHSAPLLPPDGPRLTPIDPQLYKEPFVAHNVAKLKEKAHDERAKAQISRLVDTFFGHRHSEVESRSTLGYRRFNISYPENQFRKLLKNNDYEVGAKTLLQKHQPLYIVCDIITCLDMELTESVGGKSEAGGAATVPAGEAVGIPSNILDITGEGGAKRTHSNSLHGTYDGQVIIACGYRQVNWVETSKGLLHGLKELFVHPKASGIEISATNLDPITGLTIGGAPPNGEFLGFLDSEGLDSIDSPEDSEDSEGEKFIIYPRTLP